MKNCKNCVLVSQCHIRRSLASFLTKGAAIGGFRQHFSSFPTFDPKTWDQIAVGQMDAEISLGTDPRRATEVGYKAALRIDAKNSAEKMIDAIIGSEDCDSHIPSKKP
jgi:hypothetical protein